MVKRTLKPYDPYTDDGRVTPETLRNLKRAQDRGRLRFLISNIHDSECRLALERLAVDPDVDWEVSREAREALEGISKR